MRRQFPVPVEDDKGQTHDGKAILQGAGHGSGYHGLDNMNIIGDARHECAGLFFLKKCQGELLNTFIEFVTQLPDDALTHVVHQVFFTVAAQSVHEIDDDDGQG